MTWGETATTQPRVKQKPLITKSLFRPHLSPPTTIKYIDNKISRDDGSFFNSIDEIKDHFLFYL